MKSAIFDVSGNRILVCPLNWGLGHATRCVPIVRQLVAAGKTPILAADGVTFDFLKNEFPQLELVKFPGLTVKYSASNSQLWAMIRQVPKFLYQIWHEHRKLRKLVEKLAIDTVVSDNRFGLWTRYCRCIYITHQMMIKLPIKSEFFEKLVWRFHQFFIRKFDACWIPDFAENGFSGDLSHKFPLPPNAKFVGLLSRFLPDRIEKNRQSPYQILALVSGVEPQRTIFEQQLISILQKETLPALLVRGLPNSPKKSEKIGTITLKNHLETSELAQLLATTPKIICRSGYSTVMDLATLGRTATLVPTNGQTEQEYLADYLQRFGFEKLVLKL